MSLKRYQQIASVLAFDDKSSRAARRRQDKFAAIRLLWDKWVENLKVLYRPHSNITIDEQLLGFFGRCNFKQFMPSKPSKYGLKFWVLCDSKTFFVWNIQPYLGKRPGDAPEKNQGPRVVNDLVDDLEGRNVTMDNFFTSYRLAQDLLKRGMTMVGTVRANKTFLSPTDKKAQRKEPEFSSRFYFTKDAVLVKYVPKRYRLVTLLSTFHKSGEIEQNPKKTPEIITYYNQIKGGVDSVDQLVSQYTVKRKTNRWPRAVFANMIDISALNAYILWCETNPEWNEHKLHKRRIFLQELGLELIQGLIDNRKRQPQGENARQTAQKLRKTGNLPAQNSALKKKRKHVDDEPVSMIKKPRNGARCADCDSNKDRKAYSCCSKCNKELCGTHKQIICSSCLTK